LTILHINNKKIRYSRVIDLGRDSMRKQTKYKFGVVLAVMLLLLTVSSCEKPEEAIAEVYDNSAEANWVLLTIDYPEESGIEDVIDFKVYSLNGLMTPMSTLSSYAETNCIPVVISEGIPGYVQGVGGVFENDYNSPSGWVYTVNDEMSMEAASDYELKSEDKVIWSYVTFSEANL
jgi:hypothetical protein